MNNTDKITLTIGQLKKLVSESQRKEIDETILDALMKIQSASKQVLHCASNINRYKYLDEISPEYIRLFNDYIKIIIDTAKKLEGYQYS